MASSLKRAMSIYVLRGLCIVLQVSEGYSYSANPLMGLEKVSKQNTVNTSYVAAGSWTGES